MTQTFPIPVHMSERDFQRRVVSLAYAMRWRVYHTWNSQHSHAGFPDLILVRSSRLIAAELKSERGKMHPDQEAWLSDLSHIEGAETYIWRPSDWTEIGTVLR